MYFEKENPSRSLGTELKRTVLNDWAWANPFYEFVISKNKTEIKKITIDPRGLMADVKIENNRFEMK